MMAVEGQDAALDGFVMEWHLHKTVDVMVWGAITNGSRLRLL